MFAVPANGDLSLTEFTVPTEWLTPQVIGSACADVRRTVTRLAAGRSWRTLCE